MRVYDYDDRMHPRNRDEYENLRQLWEDYRKTLPPDLIISFVCSDCKGMCRNTKEKPNVFSCENCGVRDPIPKSASKQYGDVLLYGLEIIEHWPVARPDRIVKVQVLPLLPEEDPHVPDP